jgi:hypothetical protein
VCFRSVLVLLALAATRSLAEKVTLRPKFQSGQAWTFDMKQEIASDNKATAANGHSQPFQSKVTMRRAGKLEVLTAGNGVPASIRVTFDAIDGSMEMGGQQQQAPQSPYAGQTTEPA